ncbi:MAG: GntR family transcriptional regulator [Devosia sp.]
MAQASRVGALVSRRGLTSVKQAGYDRFQRALLEGRLRPGQLVSQRDLVSMLALSIGALRELLPRLETEGLVTVMPQRGIQITMIDLPMVRDAFQMRMAFEREAVMMAVRRMPDEPLVEQRRIHSVMLERAVADSSAALFDECQDIDTSFHKLFIDGTENELLIQAYEINSIRIRLIKLDRIKLSPTSLPGAFGDHLKVLDAVLNRDLHAAIDAMDQHMLNARERAMEL